MPMLRIMRLLMNNTSSWIEPSAGITNVPLSPGVMLSLARGFLLLFWSMLIGMALALGIVQIPFVREAQLPNYVIAVCVAYLGIVLLRKVGPLSPCWTQRLRDATALLLIHVYLAPFFPWWLRTPQNGYYMANMLAIIFFGAWLFYTLNALAAEWAKVLHHTDFRIECELAAWISFFTALLPCITVLARAISPFTTGEEWEATSTWVKSNWIRRLELLYPFPLLLTALIQWRARALALQRCTQTANKLDKSAS